MYASQVKSMLIFRGSCANFMLKSIEKAKTDRIDIRRNWVSTFALCVASFAEQRVKDNF